MGYGVRDGIMRDFVENCVYGFLGGIIIGIALELIIHAITGGWLEIVKNR